MKNNDNVSVSEHESAKSELTGKFVQIKQNHGDLEEVIVDFENLDKEIVNKMVEKIHQIEEKSSEVNKESSKEFKYPELGPKPDFSKADEFTNKFIKEISGSMIKDVKGIGEGNFTPGNTNLQKQSQEMLTLSNEDFKKLYGEMMRYDKLGISYEAAYKSTFEYNANKFFDGIGRDIESGAKIAVDYISGAVKNSTIKIIEGYGKVADALQEFGKQVDKNIIEPMKKGMKAAWDDVEVFFEKVGQEIEKFFIQVQEFFEEVGKAIRESIILGLGGQLKTATVEKGTDEAQRSHVARLNEQRGQNQKQGQER